jgi:hypothetical protein
MTNDKRPLTFLEELREQRWDDHRYYHQSRVNQSLHLFSSLCFIATYIYIPFNPIVAAVLGWIIAMWSRQIGHFFFEPKGYDEVNGASFDHKEQIKVGYNLQRKVILFVAWLAVPIVLRLSPTLFGLVAPWTDRASFLNRLGVAWLGLAAIGLFTRTFYLMATRNLQTGAVWFTKILTVPFARTVDRSDGPRPPTRRLNVAQSAWWQMRSAPQRHPLSHSGLHAEMHFPSMQR